MVDLRLFRPISAALLLTLLAGCGEDPPENKVAPRKVVAAPARHVKPAEGVARDEVVAEHLGVPEIAGLPVAPGQWELRDEPAGQAALYGEPEVGAVLSIRCDRAARMIVIRRSGVEGPAISILTDHGINLFEADPPVRNGARATIARFPSNFPWFRDVLAVASGDIGIRVGDGEPLVVPSGNALAQVVNHCPK